MAADPTTLEEIDLENHTARQIATLIARELGLTDPDSLTPAQVVIQGKEQVLRKTADDVLSPPAKPGAGLVKIQLQKIATALIAAKSQRSVSKPSALQPPDDLSPQPPLPTPDRIEQALERSLSSDLERPHRAERGEMAEQLDATVATQASSISASCTPDAGSGGKQARMKSMLDPNEAAGFPRGLRKTERETALDLDRASEPTQTNPGTSSSGKQARLRSMLDPNQAAGFPRGLRKTESKTGVNLDRTAEPTPGLVTKVEQDAKNQTAVRALLLCQVCRSFGIMLRMQTETQIWLNAFAGDYAGQARVQGNLESISGLLGFVVSPILGGLSDAYGRRPLMILSPCFSVATNILIVSSPTVPSLIVRRLLMPFSSTPWHSGEAAALADMFKNDPAAYSVAKSRIEIVSSIMQIVCPLIGARLAAISLRLPWAVCGMAFSVMIAVSYKYLEETLPAAERIPFRFKSSNPLSFLKLFRCGTKMRLLALSQVWDNMCGRMATFRYEQLHQQQMLNWGLEERGRFSSYRGLLNVPSSWVSGWLLRTLGTKSSLFVGCASSSCESLCSAVSTKGAHFYLTRPLSMTSEAKRLSMGYMTATVGDACGIQQGELQSSLGNLRSIVGIITPLIWGRIYGLGVERGIPSLFYYVSAAAGAVQLLILALLVKAPDPNSITGSAKRE